MLIDHGRLVYDGEVESLKEQYGTHRTLVVEFSENCAEVAVEGAEVESREGAIVRYKFDRRTISADQLIRRGADNYAINDVTLEEPELESIIRRIYLEGYAEPETPPAAAGSTAR